MEADRALVLMTKDLAPRGIDSRTLVKRAFVMF